MTPWFVSPSFFHVLDFSLLEPYHAIRFEKDTRYYSMRIEKDLLDDWIIVVINGRIKTKLGQVRTLAFPCYSDAFDHFCEMIQVRLKRHYHLKSYLGDNAWLMKLIVYVPTPIIDDEISNTIRRMPSTKTQSSVPSDNITQPIPTQMGFCF